MTLHIKSACLFSSVVLIASLLLWWPAAAQEVNELKPSQPIERALAGGETHAYRVTLDAGQLLSLTVDQRGIDVTIKLSGPDKQSPIEINLFPDTEGAESAVLIATIAGDYRIEVVSAEKAAARGRYQVTLAPPRVATEQDRSRINAQQTAIEAERLLAEGKPEALRSAIEKYEAALPLWRVVEARREEAQALFNIGYAYQDLKDYEKSLTYFNDALARTRAIGGQRLEADTLNTLGAVYAKMGNRPRAIEHYNLALPVRRQVNDRAGEARTLNNIALLYAEQGESEKALNAYQQVLALRRAVNDRAGEATTLQNIGAFYFNRGEKRKALDHFNQALKLWRETNNRTGAAQTLNSLGTTYSDLGESQKALDSYFQALPFRRTPTERAITLNNIGRSYDRLGLSQEALSYYNQSLPLVRSVKERRGEAQTLNYMGLSYWAAGDHPKALNTLEEALKLRRELKDRFGEAAALNNLGLVYEAQGEIAKARDAYLQALPLVQAEGNRQMEAYALNNLGFTYDALGDKERALEHHRRALELSRAVGDRRREAKVRYGIARLERDRNRLREARGQIEQAVKLVESVRAKLASPELRAEYRASLQQYYDLYIDVLMRLGERTPRRLQQNNLIAEALQVSERARARSLIELLTETGADIRQGVDPTLVARERELQEQLNDRTAEQIRLLGSRGKPEQLTALNTELRQLTAALRDTQAQIRQNSPRYAALTQPQPLTLAALQQQILNPQTLLLEYALGAERSYLWVVSHDSLRSYKLPARAAIEDAARRYYELLTARNHYVANESSKQKQERIAQADLDSRRVGTELSRMLLGPIAAALGNQRLLIVTEGALQYVPFGALPKPAMFGQVSARPLIAAHEIVNLPSASTLAALRSETSKRPSPSKLAAVFADPVFEIKDERVKVVTIKAPATDKDAAKGNENSGAAQDNANKDAKPSAPVPAPTTDTARILVTKAAKDTGAADQELRVPRLPNTRREAETIVALASHDRSQAIFDFGANRAAVISADLGQYRIVHFATHGFLNSLNPELSGLVMSLVDEQGKPQNGYLLAPEIYNLKLPATELVVLSACQTGLGKEIRGEGVVGLTRGFMYAGAPRVVVSLWNVSDRATADFMKSFYQAMLKRGERPAQALRSAQLELLKLKQWQAPYYWAAFGLQGEWR